MSLMQVVLDVAAAHKAFNQAFSTQDEAKEAWIGLANLEDSKSADQQLQSLWSGLGTRQSAALLGLAICIYL